MTRLTRIARASRPWLLVLAVLPMMAQQQECAGEPASIALLENSEWVSIADSDMHTGGPTLAAIGSQSPCEAAGGYWDTDHCQLYDPDLDLQTGWNGSSFANKQAAWSTAVCVGSELYVNGGGHGDSAHNGIFAVNVHTGDWRRVTPPSTIWYSADCAASVCTPPFGGTCDLGNCNVLPDGNPASRHDYDTISTDGAYIYAIGGSIHNIGSSGQGPRNWRFHIQNETWEPIADSTATTITSSGTDYYAAGGQIFMALASFGGLTYTIVDAAVASDADPSDLLISGLSVQVLDYAQLATDDATVTVTVDGTPTDLVEGTDWDAEASDEVTAFNLATAIDAVSGVRTNIRKTVSNGTATIATTVPGDIFAVMPGTWSSGSMQRAVDVHTELLWVDFTDEIYALGHGYAWYMPRTNWPAGASSDLGIDGHLVDSGIGPGLTWYEPEKLILIWQGGPTIETIDPVTHEWGSITPGGGDPGAVNTSGGTYGRFNHCDGVLALLNGVNDPLWYVDTGI